MISTSAQSSSGIPATSLAMTESVQQIVGQQRLGFVVDALEEGHGGGKRVALGDGSRR